MLKVAPPPGNVFHNFKCGEVFCISPAVYNITCCLCAVKMHLEQFPNHFQMQHLALAEESINWDVLENKGVEILTKDSSRLESTAVKEEDPVDDPIKQEDLAEEIDEDDKSLQQLLREKEQKEHLPNKDSENVLMEEEGDDLKIGEKLEVEILLKTPKKRNSRRKLKTSESKELKSPRNANINDCDGSKIENEEDGYTEEDHLIENEDDDDNYMDKDWSQEDKASETDSEAENEDSIKDELPYPCHICKRSYRSKHGLQKHNYSVHNPNKKPPKKPKAEHKCDQCDEVFRSERDLRGHKWKHTGIFCDICGKPFTQTGNMMRHKIRHTGIKAHKCKECGKDFFTDKELKSHLICHTGLMPVICEICGKRCRDRGVLTAHMRRHTGERPAKCDVCGKSFFSFHDLNVHAVTHSSERPFKCDICGSTFQRKKALRVHKLIHSKDRKHVCKICGKGFAQSGGLNSHMRTHDAALEKTTEPATHQALVPSMLDNAHTQEEETPAGKATISNTEIGMSTGNNMLDQFMV